MNSLCRYLWIGSIVLFIYLGVLCSLTNFPYVDLANHLTRAYFISETLGGSDRGLFSFVFKPQPYILGDLVLAGLVKVLPVAVAALAWIGTLFIGFIFSVLFYFEQRKESNEVKLLFYLLGPFLATNYFFISGYLNFCFGLALAFLALGYWERFSRARNEKLAACLFYLVFTFFVYGAHLAPFLFLGIIVGIGAVYRYLSRTNSLIDLFISVFPLGLLTVNHIIGNHLGSAPGNDWYYRTFLEKVLALGGMFVRFNYLVDILFTICFSLIFILILYKSKVDINKDKNFKVSLVELALLFIAIFCSYFILPKKMGSGGEADLRAIPFLVIIGIMFIGRLSAVKVLRDPLILKQCMAISVVNLIYLTWFLIPANERIGGYSKALMMIPPQQRVLGVGTHPVNGRFQTNLHNVELYMITNNGFVPNVFSSNTAGDQLGYFSYNHYYYAPSLFWYNRHEKVDWQRVASVYDYLIIEKPFDKSRIELANISVVFENKDAVVYRINTVNHINRSETSKSDTQSN